MEQWRRRNGSKAASAVETAYEVKVGSDAAEKLVVQEASFDWPGAV